MQIKEKVVRANYLFKKKQYEPAKTLYEEVVSFRPALKSIFAYNIEKCLFQIGGVSNYIENKNEDFDNLIKNTTPSSEVKDLIKTTSERIYICMTTIDSRVDRIKPVVDSLLCQTRKPYQIVINLSKEPYLLDKGIDENNPVLKEISKDPSVLINWVENIGPYRKIYPFLEKHFAQSVTNEKVFITIDDDTIYPDYFIEQLYSKYIETNNIVAFRGRCIEIGDDAIAPYEKWAWGKNAMTFRNLPTGKDGIIYSTRFFSKDFLNIKKIKEIAPTVDDLWIKWHCALNGVKSQILNPEACSSDYKSFPVVDYSKEYRGNSLYAMMNSKKAGGKNDIAVESLEKYFLEEYGYNLKFLIDLEVE
jgi:hypothetical protein